MMSFCIIYAAFSLVVWAAIVLTTCENTLDEVLSFIERIWNTFVSLQ